MLRMQSRPKPEVVSIGKTVEGLPALVFRYDIDDVSGGEDSVDVEEKKYGGGYRDGDYVSGGDIGAEDSISGVGCVVRGVSEDVLDIGCLGFGAVRNGEDMGFSFLWDGSPLVVVDPGPVEEFVDRLIAYLEYVVFVDLGSGVDFSFDDGVSIGGDDGVVCGVDIDGVSSFRFDFVDRRELSKVKIEDLKTIRNILYG